jgi:hypothetical protein
MAETFDHGDAAYLKWLRANPTGYVVNAERSPRLSYMVLHRATCPSISSIKAPGRPGGFTERSYIKICSTNVAPLNIWVRQHGGTSGAFSKRCSRCNP